MLASNYRHCQCEVLIYYLFPWGQYLPLCQKIRRHFISPFETKFCSLIPCLMSQCSSLTCNDDWRNSYDYQHSKTSIQINITIVSCFDVSIFGALRGTGQWWFELVQISTVNSKQFQMLNLMAMAWCSTRYQINGLMQWWLETEVINWQSHLAASNVKLAIMHSMLMNIRRKWLTSIRKTKQIIRILDQLRRSDALMHHYMCALMTVELILCSV